MSQVDVSKFTYTFDFIFGDQAVDIMKCIFEQLISAHGHIIYINE